MKTLRYETMKGALAIICQSHIAGDLSVFGLTKDDVKLVMGPRIWLPSERRRVRASMDALCYGVLDALGLPRIQLPAEYIAALIAAVVAPCNMMLACAWYDGLEDTNSIIEASEMPQKLSGNQLFAMVLEFSTDERAVEAKERFRASCGVRLEQAAKTGLEAEGA